MLEQLQEFLREKKVLLLLDNFEHVVRAATQVADLLDACPRLKMLITSREALHVRVERKFPVPALALPDPKHLPGLSTLSQYEAVALFIERAQAVKPDFQVTNANAPAVAEICARLDGLPLAIELAAARTRMLPPQALLTRLGQRLQLLTSSLRDAPARQHTLRKTIQWSYDLLPAPEQHVFRRLSVFVNGCTLEAVEAISETLGDGEAEVLDEVTSLIDKNLLQQTAQEEAVQGINGYLVRANPEWLERLEQELNNLRATIAWSLESAQAGSRLETAFSVGSVLAKFCMVRGFCSEGQAILEQLLAHGVGAAPVARAKTLIAVADFAEAQGNVDRAEALYQESLVLYRELGDKRGIAYSLRGLGWVAQTKGHNSTAEKPSTAG
jgi:predicted ATPase